MSVKIRLQRYGRKSKPFYHIVIADVRSPRDGKFIKKIGTYDPLKIPYIINIKTEEAIYWLEKGAQPTNTVKSMLSNIGVFYKIHLLSGYKKGYFSKDEVEKKFQIWLESKKIKFQENNIINNNKIKKKKNKNKKKSNQKKS